MRGSNGYRIQVDGQAHEVELSAEGPAGTAAYTVPGWVTRRGVHANFGRRGKVNVAFRPSGRARIETPPRHCEGKPRVTRWGAFVGTIRFKGERGYTRLRRQRAGGRVRTFSHWRCPERGKRANAGAAKDPLPVVWEVSEGRTGLAAGAVMFSPDGGEGPFLYYAALRERRKRMRIERSFFEIGGVEGLTAKGDAKGFSYDESLTNATISFPFPFAGRAEFERAPNGKVAWTGSLSVMLPGTARILLIGPRSRARLYRLTKGGIAKPGV